MSPMMASTAALQGQPLVLTTNPPREVANGTTTPVPRGGALSVRQAQRLLKPRLPRSLLVLFPQLTGLELQVRWHPPSQPLSAKELPRCGSDGAGGQVQVLRPGCEPCRSQACIDEWAKLRSEGCIAHQCGRVNFYACLKLEQQPVVTLLLQQPSPASATDKHHFACAVELTRLVLHDLEATLQATQAARQLESIQHTLRVPAVLPTLPLRAGSGNSKRQTRVNFRPEAQVQRPRTSRRRAGSAAPRPGAALRSANGTAPGLRPSRNHRRQLVERMVEYLHSNYSHPVQLHDLAAAMNLNPSYASSLFSTTLGIPFHQYLQEFRLARAKDLLRDPLKRISEVAYSVGYSNPNHFRNVFTSHVGLPPSAWRETADANP